MYKLLPNLKALSLKIAGTVMAGWPSPAEEELVDTMTLDEYLIPNKDAVFIFRVKGDSMKDAGIIDGDIALVERGRTPKNYDIVIAEIDGELTLKYFRKEGKRVWLEAANPDYEPIYPQQMLKVPAVLVSLIRKYKDER